MSSTSSTSINKINFNKLKHLLNTTHNIKESSSTAIKATTGATTVSEIDNINLEENLTNSSDMSSIKPTSHIRSMSVTSSTVSVEARSKGKQRKQSKKEMKLQKMEQLNNKKGRKNSSNDSDSDAESSKSFCSTGSDKLISDKVDPAEQNDKKFIKLLDDLTDKSAQTRTKSLQSMCELLRHKEMYDSVENRKSTVIDCIEKSIRRGKGAEQIWAARLAPIALLQLDEDETIYKKLKQTLFSTVQDNSASFDVRSNCCTPLVLLELFENDIENTFSLLQFFESIFRDGYFSPNSVTAEVANLHSEALSAWGLLLTLVPPKNIATHMNNKQCWLPSIEKLMSLLESPHLGIRSSAGEVIALLLECGREHDKKFLNEYTNDLIDAVKTLATDSNRCRAKRDRKVQRVTFRDVLRYLEENISPNVTISFGTECLVLNSWKVQHQYELLCRVLGSGMNFNLQKSNYIRDIFQLGDVKLEGPAMTKANKIQRQWTNASACKSRTILRNLNRDKRSAIFH